MKKDTLLGFQSHRVRSGDFKWNTWWPEGSEPNGRFNLIE